MLPRCLLMFATLAWAGLAASPMDWNPASGLKCQPASLLQRPRGIWVEAGQDYEDGWYNDAFGVWGPHAWGLGLHKSGPHDLWRPRALWQSARALGSRAGLRLGWGLRVGPDPRVDGDWIYRAQLGLEALAPWDSDLSLALREINLRAPASGPSSQLSLGWARDFEPLRLSFEWQVPSSGRASVFLGASLKAAGLNSHFRAGLELHDPHSRWWLSWGHEYSDWILDLAWAPGLGRGDILNLSIGLPLGAARQRPLPDAKEPQASPTPPPEAIPALEVRIERYGTILVLIWEKKTDELGAQGFEVWSRVLKGASLIKAHSGLLHENQFKTELSLPGAQYAFQVRAIDAKGRIKAASKVIEVGSP